MAKVMDSAESTRRGSHLSLAKYVLELAALPLLGIGLVGDLMAINASHRRGFAVVALALKFAVVGLLFAWRAVMSDLSPLSRLIVDGQAAVFLMSLSYDAVLLFSALRSRRKPVLIGAVVLSVFAGAVLVAAAVMVLSDPKFAL